MLALCLSLFPGVALAEGTSEEPLVPQVLATEPLPDLGPEPDPEPNPEPDPEPVPAPTPLPAEEIPVPDTDGAATAQVTSMDELEKANEDPNITAIEVTQSFTVNFLITVTKPVTVAAGVTLTFNTRETSFRFIFEAPVTNNGTITQSGIGLLWFHSLVNNGDITGYSDYIVCNYGQYSGSGSINADKGQILFNVAADLKTKPSLAYKTTEVYVGTPIDLVGTGFLEGVNLSEVLKISWNTSVAGNKIPYTPTAMDVDRRFRISDISLNSGYTILRTSGKSGSPTWNHGSTYITVQALTYDTVYLGGSAADDENPGNTTDKAKYSLESALDSVKDGGTIVLVADANVFSLASVNDSQYLPFVRVTKNVTLRSADGSNYQLLSNDKSILGNAAQLRLEGVQLAVENVRFVTGAEGLAIVNAGNGSSFLGSGNLGSLVSIYGLDTVTLNGATLNLAEPHNYDSIIEPMVNGSILMDAPLLHGIQAVTTLNINSGTSLTGSFSVQNLVSAGTASTLNCNLAASPSRVSGSASLENPMNFNLLDPQVDKLLGTDGVVINFDNSQPATLPELFGVSNSHPQGRFTVGLDAETRLYVQFVYLPADYSAVDAALAKIPADLSVYTEESVAALEAAKNAVVPNLLLPQQDVVNDYAAAIEAAIAALVKKPVPAAPALPPEVPATGDSAQPLFWLAMMSLALAGLVLTLPKRKKSK